MSGHNRWSKVKNVKGPLDAKRGKLYSKLTKEIIVAARTGGGSPDTNARLRQAIMIARGASMPKDNIERAIKKGTGELQGEAAVEEHVYEGYGPNGIAVMIEAATDNKNRTVSDLRNLLRSGGGSFAEAGSVAWMFTHYGHLVFDKTKYPEDKVMEVALEAGAQDVSEAPDSVEVLTDVTDVYRVREVFDRLGMHPDSAGFSYIPKTAVPLDNVDTAKAVIEFLDAIEDHDDVQKVHSNIVISERVLDQLADSKN